MSHKSELPKNCVVMGKKGVEIYCKTALYILTEFDSVLIWTSKKHLPNANELCRLLSCATEEIRKRKKINVSKDYGDFEAIEITLDKLPMKDGV